MKDNWYIINAGVAFGTILFEIPLKAGLQFSDNIIPNTWSTIHEPDCI